MYWLFDSQTQKKVRDEIEALVLNLSKLDTQPSQDDQLFPFVGRKDKRKAAEVVKCLTAEGETVCDPFAGSGMLVYAAAQEKRKVLSCEYEVYTQRMANAPWRFPKDKAALNAAYKTYIQSVKQDLDELYQTKCVCGNLHVLDSLFFDREPLTYKNITKHERLGKNGENVCYRGRYKCPKCKATEKHFDDFDAKHLEAISKRPVSSRFDATLIENSRINLSKDFTVYKSLFPHRSMLALDILWNGIKKLNASQVIKDFLIDNFLSIIPQAKFKDYRSKSQDLHCPKVQLREVNLLYRFEQGFEKRLEGIAKYNFATEQTNAATIECEDYREHLAKLQKESVDLLLTDPPWADGNAYFEKAQLYHPWLDYSLAKDTVRLEKEVVITDAPSRKAGHDEARWWQDVQELFDAADRVIKPYRYLSLMFRPIKASKWLEVLNHLKFLARSAGFEPLLTVDIGSKDPSMRVQQSACYAFVDDLIMIFVKVPQNLRRWLFKGQDIDKVVYGVAEAIQEKSSAPFSYQEWRKAFSDTLIKGGLHELNLPIHEARLLATFKQYCDEVQPQKYLTKHLTPFSDQLFDLPATERIFTYVPKVVEDLASTKNEFSYSEFLLKLSQYLENGTRSLIQEVKELDMQSLLQMYAEQIGDSKYFKVRKLPTIPTDIKKVLDLDPYGFEAFVGHLLVKQGFTQVVLAGRAGDRGVDLVAKDPDGKSAIVQCKQWGRNNVGSTPIQRLDSFARTRNAARKILITTSDFTPDGIDEARITSTETINGKQLGVLIAKFMPEFAS